MIDSHIEYNEKGEATAFVGEDAVSFFAAAVLVSALRMYAKCGIRANRAYTPTNMRVAATRITKKSYKRTELLKAADEVEAWAWTMKAALPQITR